MSPHLQGQPVEGESLARRLESSKKKKKNIYIFT
jgi:hypothetical protein